MSAFYYGRRPDPRLERRELARRITQAEERDRKRSTGCGCGCGCSGTRGAVPTLTVEARAFCAASMCVTEGASGFWVNGMAHRYGVWSSSLCGHLDDSEKCFREIIDVGAFDDAVARSDLDVAIVVNHDEARLLARATKRPDADARVWADRVGLHFEFRVPHTPLGRAVLADVRSGRVRGTSFLMRDVTAVWNETTTGELVRRITRVGKLEDVTIVDHRATPAYSFSAPDPELALA